MEIVCIDILMLLQNFDPKSRPNFDICLLILLTHTHTNILLLYFPITNKSRLCLHNPDKQGCIGLNIIFLKVEFEKFSMSYMIFRLFLNKLLYYSKESNYAKDI